MDVDECQASPISLEEDLINETIPNETVPVEDNISHVNQGETRMRTASLTYTFPDPEEPSKNLVLELPLSTSQKACPSLTITSESGDIKVKTSVEETSQSGVEPSSLEILVAASTSLAHEKDEFLPEQSINQPADPTGPMPTKSWLSYVQHRIRQAGCPLQRSVLDRQRLLFQFLSDDHWYGQKVEASAERRTSSTAIKSKKTLFFADSGRNSVAGGDWNAVPMPDDGELDVVTDDTCSSLEETLPLPYNRQKAVTAMLEIERFMYQIRGASDMDTVFGRDGRLEEDPLVKTCSKRGTWTSRQRSFFDSCIKILQVERHVRLSCAGVLDEPIIRRLSLDKAAGRFRRLMANVEWSGRLVYWLHAVLVDGLNSHMLAIYFEILQTLKPKIPELVNSLVNYILPPAVIEGESSDGLLSLLDTPWDPVARSVYRFDKTIKLPRNPIFIVAPHPYSHGQENASHSRIEEIVKFLTRLGSVVQVDGDTGEALIPSDMYKNMLIATRDTLVDLKKIHAERALVLIGLGIGSMVACQASLLEQCSAVVCFGFPLKTPRGIHGDYGDPLLKMDAAVQFIVGLDAVNCPHAEFYDFWEKLTCDTEVVWAAACDSYLRMNSSAKMSLKMTQSMVDRCFLEKVVEFLQQALLKDPVRRAEPAVPEVSKKRKAKAPPTTPRASSKKIKTQLHDAEVADKTKKTDLLHSESTMSSQEMSNGGGSQSSSDTLATDLVTPSTPDPSGSPLRSLDMVSQSYHLSSTTSSSDPYHPEHVPFEQSTLSIHFTTSQAPLIDHRRRQDIADTQRRYYDNANRSSWPAAHLQSSVMHHDGSSRVTGAIRPATPRISVIAHTGVRSPPDSPTNSSSTFTLPK